MRYPLGLVGAEASIVTKRLDVRLAAQIGLMQTAFSSIPNMNVKAAATAKAAKRLESILKELLDGE